MPMLPVNTPLLALSCAAILACAGAALGQNALGDGRRLDNNLSVSTGRVNPRASSVSEQVRYNNSVIYGTAPSGKSFQGYLGYRAPDQFGGSLPSDTLYNFNRDSYVSGLANAGIRGSDALRYQFSLATGQQVPGFLAGGISAVPRNADVSSTATGTALRSTSDFLTGQSYRPSLIGIRHDKFGAEETAKASPLLGIAWIRTADSPLGNALSPQTPELSDRAANAAGIPTIPPSVAPSGNSPENGVPDGPGMTPGGVPIPPKTTISPFSGLETSVRGVRNVLDRDTFQPDRIDNSVASDRTLVHNQLLNRMRDEFPTKPAGKPGKPGEDDADQPVTLEMQMDRLHRALSGEPEPDKKQNGRSADGSLLIPSSRPPGVASTKVNTRAPTPASPERAAASPPATTPLLPPSASNAATNMRRDDRGRIIDPTLEALSPEFLRAVKKVQEKKVEHFVEPAPSAGPDNSSDPALYRSQMREGERLLSAGRYFEAEDHFVRAIASSPRDPMARAARLHAQIGAGLYLSAATNLRALVAAYPEMIAVRYADNLLPAAERAQAVVEQLQEQRQRTESALGREAALLVAYFGYQRGDQKLVVEGLDDFGKRISADASGDPDRALERVLNAAWAGR